MEGEEEDVSNYWVTFTNRKDTGNWKRKHYIVLFGELALEEAMDLL
jgi:hypothetical protein